MKLKTTLILLFGLAFSISSFSQFSAGLETGLWVTHSDYLGSLGLGGSIKYEAAIKNKLSWTCSFGYQSFFKSFQDGFATRIKIITISGGVKHHFSETGQGFYMTANLGLNFINEVTSFPPPYPVTIRNDYTRFSLSPGIGYRINRWDVSVRYIAMWGYHSISDGFSYLSLRSAYVFGAK